MFTHYYGSGLKNLHGSGGKTSPLNVYTRVCVCVNTVYVYVCTRMCVSRACVCEYDACVRVCVIVYVCSTLVRLVLCSVVHCVRCARMRAVRCVLRRVRSALRRMRPRALCLYCSRYYRPLVSVRAALLCTVALCASLFIVRCLLLVSLRVSPMCVVARPYDACSSAVR